MPDNIDMSSIKQVTLYLLVWSCNDGSVLYSKPLNRSMCYGAIEIIVIIIINNNNNNNIIIIIVNTKQVTLTSDAITLLLLC